MNQITMLYTPMRYVSAVEVKQGDEKLFDLEGSMTLSENPRISSDYQIRRVRDFGDHEGHERNRVEARRFSGCGRFPEGNKRIVRINASPCCAITELDAEVGHVEAPHH